MGFTRPCQTRVVAVLPRSRPSLRVDRRKANSKWQCNSAFGKENRAASDM